MSVLATNAAWQPAHSAAEAPLADSAYGKGGCPKWRTPQPLVFANLLLSLTVTSRPLYSPLKYPRPEGSAREPSGNVGSRTRVSSLTMMVPSGNDPVFRYTSRFFSSTYT